MFEFYGSMRNINSEEKTLNRQISTDIYLAETPVLTRPTLRQGDQGDYVSLLQSQLKELMFYNGNVSGSFDNDTMLSVKAFQTNNKLTVDGIVGKDTWSSLIYLYSPLASCSGMTHVVQKGDTLWSIARKYNTTVDEIMRLNNLTSTLLSIGQVLIISGTDEGTPPSNNIVYTVQRGDTLWSIAKRFNTTVDAIKRYNNLTSDLLSIGQQLTIPGIEAIVSYTVQRGDTLWSIANRFNTTVDAIKTLNNLTSNLISIGQILKIPT